MGIVDTFSKEDRVQVTFTDFYNLMKQASAGELIANAVKGDVPHKHIRAMLGEYEEKTVDPYDDIEDGDAPLK